MAHEATARLPHMSLNDYAANVFSQNGEDGILEEIFTRLPGGLSDERWCVEFGAWDGVYLSNTCKLIRQHGFKAVLIEGDPAKVIDLERNFPEETVYKICEFVGLEGGSTLDRIMARTPIPQDFDVLSIDIDGCDYWILDSLKDYQPKVIVIEFNPSIPNEVDFVQEPDFSIKHGASPRSLCTLAQQKGYSLVATTACNLFFVRNDFVHFVAAEGETLTLEALRDDNDARVFLFSGFDGFLYLSRDFPMRWHSHMVETTELQAIPALFRKYPYDWGRARRVLWRGYERYTLARRITRSTLRNMR